MNLLQQFNTFCNLSGSACLESLIWIWLNMLSCHAFKDKCPSRLTPINQGSIVFLVFAENFSDYIGY